MKNKYLLLFSSLSILLFFVGFFLFVVMPDTLVLNFGVLIAAIIFSLVCLILERKRIMSYLSSTHWKNLSSAFISLFLVFCILGVVNYIGVKKPLIYDFSKRKLNSLSEQTHRVLKNFVNEDVEFIIFSSATNKLKIQAFLNLYNDHSSHVSISHVDPVLRPDVVQKFNVVQAPSIVLKKGERSVVVTDMRELEVTNGLIKLFREVDPVLCFNMNPKFNDSSELGYSALINFLKNSSFNLKVVDLLKASEIPHQCKVFINWGVERNLLAKEIDMISKFSLAGGKVLSSFGPMFKDDNYKSMRKLYADNGLKIENDIVIDMRNHMSGSKGSAPFVSQFDTLGVNHNRGQRVAFTLSNSVLPTNENKSNFLPLALTSDDSWAEKNIIEVLADTVTFNDGDRPGPVVMAGAITVEERPRYIAFGNSSFVSNKFLSLSTNFTYFLNILHWTVGEDMLTSLHTSIFKEKPLYIGNMQKNFILFVCVIGMPILFLFFAIFTYRKRRV